MVGEEESDGGWYEILDPLSINSPVEVTDRATGATTDPSKVVKRKAVGLLAFEGMVILQDGTMHYGDENPPLGKAGGAIAGDTDANHFDNVAFQPRTGNLIVLEDGAVEVVKSDGSTEMRGNDIWMLLPDGADRDVHSDGAIRILSLRDTDFEPTGFIFDASGENAYVHLQHRNTGLGALLKISGFKVKDE
jgi:hypothetical protein